MKKTVFIQSYKADKADKEILPLGGIATGYIGISQNASLQNFRFSSAASDTDSTFALLCVKAKRNDGTKSSAVLCGPDKYGSVLSSPGVNTGYFESCEFSNRFPFYDFDFLSSDIPAKIHMTAFNPFVPPGFADSGIPAAFFEVEIFNTSEIDTEFSIALCCGGFFGSEGCYSDCCVDLENTFVVMAPENSKESCHNVCIASDSEDFSVFTNYSDSNDSAVKEFFTEFEKNDLLTFKERPKNSDKNVCSSALCAHFSLKGGASKKIRFCLSWYFAYNELGRFEKNYYSQYFESSSECAAYCFKHWNRMKSESEKFSDSLSLSTVPQCVIDAVRQNIAALKAIPLFRSCDGALYTDVPIISLSDLYLNLYALSYLYPELDFSMLKSVLQSVKQDYSDTRKRLITVISAYRNFSLNGDVERLIEYWFYISKCIDYEEIDKNSEFYSLYTLALCACEIMAGAVKDRVRRARYSEYAKTALSAINCGEVSVSVEVKWHAELLGFSKQFENAKVKFSEHDDGVMLSCLLLKSKNPDEAFELLKKIGADSDFNLTGYSLIHFAAGFEYSAHTNTVSVNPVKGLFSPQDVFRCPFCVGECNGIAEMGIDYVEIQVMSGTMPVRNFKVPGRPLMVLYGGRKWRFDTKEGMAVMDGVLNVTPEKKLTVIVDL